MFSTRFVLMVASATSTCGLSSSSNAACAARATVSASSLNNMPKIGLGTYLLDKTDIPTVIPKAIELGYRRIDCAPVYFNEMEIGDALHKVLSSKDSSVTRQDLFMVSKLPSPFHRHVELALRKTLHDLRLDYLDLYLIHWPVAFYFVPIDPTVRGYENEDIDDSRGGLAIDNTVSLWETWQAMQNLVHQGLVRHIGLSNTPVALLHELLAHQPTIRPALNQIELHPYLTQSHLVQYCQHHDIHVQAYSPLGTPGYKEEGEPILLEDDILQNIAQKYDTIPAQVALAWALQRNTSVVVKSRSLEHLKSNLAAQTLILQKDDIRTIDSLNRNYRFFRPEDWWGHYGPVFS